MVAGCIRCAEVMRRDGGDEREDQGLSHSLFQSFCLLNTSEKVTKIIFFHVIRNVVHKTIKTFRRVFTFQVESYRCKGCFQINFCVMRRPKDVQAADL